MEQSMQWFVFFKDQLLLKKEYTTNGENKYGIPHGVTPPVTPAAGCKIHEVTLTGGKKVKGLRTRTARTRNRRMGNDRLARFLRLPAIGRLSGSGKSIPDTLLGQPQPFLSRMRHSYGTADSYHEEMPGVRQWDVSSRFYGYHRADTERQRNIAGTCTQLPRHVPRVSSRLPRNGRNVGTMRRAGSYGRNGAKGEKHHLFRQSALALSQRINGRIIADYESGEIKLQADELSSGAFYSKDDLPKYPGN